MKPHKQHVYIKTYINIYKATEKEKKSLMGDLFLDAILSAFAMA